MIPWVLIYAMRGKGNLISLSLFLQPEVIFNRALKAGSNVVSPSHHP